MKVESETGRIRLTVPDQMYEIPLGEDAARRAERVYESLLRARPDLTSAQCWEAVRAAEQMLAGLVREGAVYVGTIVARSEADPARLATARFCVLLKEAVLPHDRPFDSIAEQLSARDEPRRITFEEFPAGPALLIEDAPASHLGRFAQVLFSIPERGLTATLGLATESVDDWAHFLDVLRAVARTVSFSDPEVAR